MKALVFHWFAAVIVENAWIDIDYHTTIISYKLYYHITHHPVPLQFVDQRRQTATARFAFSIHHLKQAAGHSAFHHCSKTKPGWNTNQPQNQHFQVELLRTDLHVMHCKCPRKRALRESFASPAPAAYPESPPVSQVCPEAKGCLSKINSWQILQNAHMTLLFSMFSFYS